MEGGRHSSTAEHGHNHRVPREREGKKLSALLFLKPLFGSFSCLSAILGQSTLHLHNSVVLLASLLFI